MCLFCPFLFILLLAVLFHSPFMWAFLLIVAVVTLDIFVQQTFSFPEFDLVLWNGKNVNSAKKVFYIFDGWTNQETKQRYRGSVSYYEEEAQAGRTTPSLRGSGVLRIYAVESEVEGIGTVPGTTLVALYQPKYGTPESLEKFFTESGIDFHRAEPFSRPVKTLWQVIKEYLFSNGKLGRFFSFLANLLSFNIFLKKYILAIGPKPPAIAGVRYIFDGWTDQDRKKQFMNSLLIFCARLRHGHVHSTPALKSVTISYLGQTKSKKKDGFSVFDIMMFAYMIVMSIIYLIFKVKSSNSCCARSGGADSYEEPPEPPLGSTFDLDFNPTLTNIDQVEAFLKDSGITVHRADPFQKPVKTLWQLVK